MSPGMAQSTLSGGVFHKRGTPGWVTSLTNPKNTSDERLVKKSQLVTFSEMTRKLPRSCCFFANIDVSFSICSRFFLDCFKRFHNHDSRHMTRFATKQHDPPQNDAIGSQKRHVLFSRLLGMLCSLGMTFNTDCRYHAHPPKARRHAQVSRSRGIKSRMPACSSMHTHARMHDFFFGPTLSNPTAVVGVPLFGSIFSDRLSSPQDRLARTNFYEVMVYQARRWAPHVSS